MKVSVVMTCYNTSKYIPEAIMSVVKQTYKNWELIIVDDASTDNTVDVVLKCLAKFKIADRSRLFVHVTNCGVGKSLSDAIKYSSGELVAVLDSDDVLDKKALAKVVTPHILNRNLSLVYTDYMVCNINMQRVRRVRNFQIPQGKTYLNYMKGVSHFKCFKKSFYNKTEGIDETLLKAADKDLVLKLEEVGKLFHVDYVGYFYREHGRNLSNSFFRRPKEERVQIRISRKAIMEQARIRRKKLAKMGQS